MNIRVGARTDVGLVRDHNEDAFLVEDSLYGVADGMGGHLAGDVASETAVDVISRRWRSGEPGSITEIVQQANAEIWRKAQRDPEMRGMGTTCTMLVVDGDRGLVAHVGDSRAYLLRDEELKQITQDHTVVERMVREGTLQPEEAERHPHRNIITRALGVDEDVEVDRIDVELREGDRLLLCSDGLSSMVPAGVIQDVLSTDDDPEHAAERLVELANSAGGEDNITVVVLHVTGGAATERDVASRPGERAETAPATAPTPAARATSSAGEGVRSRGSKYKRLLAWAVVLAVVGIAAYVGLRSVVINSWFVGVDGDGFVTIYQGIPEEVAGMTFRESDQTTSISIDDLPEFRKDDLRDGIKVDSRDDAERTVTNLQREASRSPQATATGDAA